ncbi:MAG: bifunctional UDP-N-acetylglucosamine diphosphorylase/glucosamine-1-phosphate N-acetyltransferase GlmU [Solirubrobacterales bacterium]
MAAGKGTRMNSDTPKVLHPVGGLPMILWPVVAAQTAGADRIVCVVGPGSPVGEILPGSVDTAIQKEARGTADAVRAAELKVAGSEQVLVLSADVPLVDADLIGQIARHHSRSGAAMTVVTAVLDDPSGYGRVVRETDGAIEQIVETKVTGDATEEQLALNEVNSGIYAFESEALFEALAEVGSGNAQGEFYLPDVLPLLRAKGKSVSAFVVDSPEFMLGVNDRVDLGLVQHHVNRRIVEYHQRRGVTIVDPGSTWIEGHVEIGQDTVIEPGTYLRGKTTIGANAVVGPQSTLTDSVVHDGARILHSYLVECEVGPDASVGPFAYLRPGAKLAAGSKAGTFVEIKNSNIGAGAKVPHLSYIGDTDVGAGSNLGAATITANYDGRNKHRTEIGRDVRTGVDTTLVAPVSVGDGAYTGAGSVITKDVPADALAVARSRQKVIEDYAKRKRDGSNHDG